MFLANIGTRKAVLTLHFCISASSGIFLYFLLCQAFCTSFFFSLIHSKKFYSKYFFHIQPQYVVSFLRINSNSVYKNVKLFDVNVSLYSKSIQSRLVWYVVIKGQPCQAGTYKVQFPYMPDWSHRNSQYEPQDYLSFASLFIYF